MRVGCERDARRDGMPADSMPGGGHGERVAQLLSCGALWLRPCPAYVVFASPTATLPILGAGLARKRRTDMHTCTCACACACTCTYTCTCTCTCTQARKKEAADKAAKVKREREEMKAAMARDRAEVAARGPAQASVARKLPSESGGTMTSAMFQEQEEAEERRNAQ